MFHRLAVAVMVGVGLWMASVVVRVEIQNAAAGYYLPRQDHEGGKWRVAHDDIPNVRLRNLVSTVGLLQYLLAPLVLMLAAYHVTARNISAVHWLAGGSGLIALISWGIAISRGYYTSLGL